MNTTTHTAVTAPAPSMSDETASLMWHLTGFHPALNQVVYALRDLMNTPLSADDSRNVIGAIGGLEDTNLVALLGLVVRDLADADLNPALRSLAPSQQQQARAAGVEFAASLEDALPCELAAEVGCVIDGT